MTILENVLPDSEDNKEQEHGEENYLETLVGEGKKYKTPAELAKAKVHADKHIETILNEKRELEAKYTALSEHQKTIKEIMDELKVSQGGGTSKETELNKEVKKEPEVDINKLIEQKLKEESNKRSAEEKAAILKQKLVTSFGDFKVASEAIRKYVDGDNDKFVAIDKLLQSDYEGAVELIKKKSGVDHASFSDKSSTKKVTMPSDSAGLTWSKCQEIRKKDPKTYKSLDFQMNMHKAAAANPNFLKS